MRFGLSEEQTLLSDSLGKFLDDASGLEDVRKIASGETDNRALWQGLTDLGIPGLLIAEEQGGVGLGSLDAAIVAEALGARVASAPFIGAAMASRALAGSSRFEDMLGNIAAGKVRVGIGFTEAVGARVDGRLALDGDNVSGRAIFVIDAEADYYLIATPEKALVLIPADEATRSQIKTIDKTRSTCSLTMNNAKAELVSEDPNVYFRALDTGRLVLAADTLGAAQFMLDAAVDYAKQREQFNRPIGSFQAVKHMCAEMAAALEPCRSLVWYAGHALDNVPDEARLTVCHAKAHLGEVGKFVAKTSTEVHGGMGFTDLLGLHYWFKRIGWNRQMLGAPELVREEAAAVQGLTD